MKSKILTGHIFASFFIILLLGIFFVSNSSVEAARSNFSLPPVGTIVVYRVAGLPPYNNGTQIRFVEVTGRGLINSPKVLAQSQFLGLTLSEMSASRREKSVDVVYEIENVTPLNFNYPTIALKHRSYDEPMNTFVEQDLPLPQGYLLRDIWTATDQNNNLYVIATGRPSVGQPTEIKLYSINSANSLVSSSTLRVFNPTESISTLKGAIDPWTGNIHVIANVYTTTTTSAVCDRKIFVFDSVTFSQIQEISFPLCDSFVPELKIGPQREGFVVLLGGNGNLEASYLTPANGQWSQNVLLSLPQAMIGGPTGVYLFPGNASSSNSIALATTEYSTTTFRVESKLRLSHDTGRTFLSFPVSLFATFSSAGSSYGEFHLARFKERSSDIPFVLGKSSNELKIFFDPTFAGPVTQYIVDQTPIASTQYFGDISVVEY